MIPKDFILTEITQAHFEGSVSSKVKPWAMTFITSIDFSGQYLSLGTPERLWLIFQELGGRLVEFLLCSKFTKWSHYVMQLGFVFVLFACFAMPLHSLCKYTVQTSNDLHMVASEKTF